MDKGYGAYALALILSLLSGEDFIMEMSVNGLYITKITDNLKNLRFPIAYNTDYFAPKLVEGDRCRGCNGEKTITLVGVQYPCPHCRETGCEKEPYNMPKFEVATYRLACLFSDGEHRLFLEFHPADSPHLSDRIRLRDFSSMRMGVYHLHQSYKDAQKESEQLNRERGYQQG